MAFDRLDSAGLSYLWGKIKSYVSSAVKVTGIKGDSENSYRTGNVNITKANIGLGNVGNFKAVSTVSSQGLSDTEKSNARSNIGAGTSSLTLGTGSGNAYRGDYGNSAYIHAVTNKGSAFASGLYKITTNSEGHVTAAIAVTKADITGLGIPGSDTNTWRGIQNNLTSTSTSDSLSANQGRILNENKVDKTEPTYSIDKTASSGTEDGDLYAALSSLDWTNVVD